MNDISVFYEATPNPQSMKFIVTSQIASDTAHFNSAGEAARSPLAQKILGFPWAAGVMIGPAFVTITKQDWVDWDIIADPLSELIKEHLQRGEVVLAPPVDGVADEDSREDSPIVLQIKRILREEIRPAVAMDGGDISFHKYEDGRVYLNMQGACAGCPSSSYTLKEGIETRLKESIPEVQEVVQV